MKAAAAVMISSSKPSGDVGVAFQDHANDKHHASTESKVDTVAGGVGALELDEEEKAQVALLLAEGANKGGQLAEGSDLLPAVVEKFLLNELAAHAQIIVEGHPLASNISPHLIANMSHELSREILGVASTAFFAFLHRKLNLIELPEALSNGTISSIDDPESVRGLSAPDLEIIEHIKEAVDHVLQVSSGLFV
jgi:hypothetical protein